MKQFKRLQGYKDLVRSGTLVIYFQPGDGSVYELYIDDKGAVTFDQSKPLRPYQMKPNCVLI